MMRRSRLHNHFVAVVEADVSAVSRT
jgi:hypothetical protein